MSYAPYGEGYNGGLGFEQFTAGGYAGTVYDNENRTGSLIDFMYRRYNPTQGRWISPDPAGLSAVDPTNPQTWNRYAYVGNKPLSTQDPSGLRPPENAVNCSWDSCSTVGDSNGGGGGTIMGNDIFDALMGAPGTYTGFDMYGNFTWGFSVSQWYSDEAAIESALTPNANTAACAAQGLQATFPNSTVSVGTATGEVGGHWNFQASLQFSSSDMVDSFISDYIAASAPIGPPARFGAGPAIHLENVWFSDTGAYALNATVHIDQFNPNTGPLGIAGHVGYDGIWGHIAQAFGGNIDTSNCSF